jgi:hypothetical protein
VESAATANAYSRRDSVAAAVRWRDQCNLDKIGEAKLRTFRRERVGANNASTRRRAITVEQIGALAL